jgi:hypothetical protein
VAWLAGRTVGSAHGLHPCLRSSARVSSGFSRSHGQATPHGRVISRLPHFDRRAFYSSNQPQSANHVRTDCCGFFAYLLDAHPRIGEQATGARLKGDSTVPLTCSCAASAKNGLSAESAAARLSIPHGPCLVPPRLQRPDPLVCTCPNCSRPVGTGLGQPMIAAT